MREAVLAERGWLQDPYMHDGYLDGLHVGDTAARIHLRTVAGERFILELRGVHALIANNFREGNIVFDVFLITGREPHAKLVAALYPPPDMSVNEAYRLEDAARTAKIVSEIVAGKRVFCVIEESYGCELVADCDSYALLDEVTP